MIRIMRVASGVVSVCLLAGCGGGGGGSAPAAPQPPQQPPPQQPPPQTPPTAIVFKDTTAASGIDYAIGYTDFKEQDLNSVLVEAYATGGAAAGDYDGDGDIDVFITRGDIGPNLLYRNNGSGVFREVADRAGLAYTAGGNQNYRHSGPTFADMDGDEDLDLFIGGLFGDPSFIFTNNGDGTFTDVTAGSGIDAMQSHNSVSAAFGDYDLDGDLDMFVAHWGSISDVLAPITDPVNFTDTEHLWRNDSTGGNIVFSSVSDAAGISPSVITLSDPLKYKIDGDWSFTPTFARINDDLYPEILLVADFNRSHLFTNNGDGTFTNDTDTSVLTDDNGMGSALGDYDNDGDLDWFVTSIKWPNEPDSGNRFYENDNGIFVDRTMELGVLDGGWGWGTCFLDFENDGDLDLYDTNGWDLERPEDFEFDVTRAFEGSGGGPFTEVAANLGLDDTDQGRGVVCADFDNDGDTDILQLHRGSSRSATMWRNDTSGNNFLRVKLRGEAPNTEAAGARIFVTIGTVTQMREITIGNNFVSQNPTIQVFGLGSATQVDELRVEWPDGKETVRNNVAAGRSMNLNHPDR